MLAREYCDAASPKIKFKPIILSHRASPCRSTRAFLKCLRRRVDDEKTISLQP